MSALQVPDTLTYILVSFVLGLWSDALSLSVKAPDYVLRPLQNCTSVEGWPFPVASKTSIVGKSCVFDGLVTGEPSTQYRLRLTSDNRGVMPDTIGRSSEKLFCF